MDHMGSISGARAASSIQMESAAVPLQTDDDDSSLVLYKDPSTVSTQRSRGSVVSGAHEQGDVFFTALKKQPSWQSDFTSDTYLQAVDNTTQGSLSGAYSEANPVQSLTRSDFFSVADDDCSGSLAQESEDGSSLTGLGTSSESSYKSAVPGQDEPSMQEASCNDSVEAGPQLTSAVLDVINSLYGKQPATSTSPCQWHQLSPSDQALKFMPVSSAAAAVTADQATGAPAAGTTEAVSQAAGDARQPRLLQQQEVEQLQQAPAAGDAVPVLTPQQSAEAVSGVCGAPEQRSVPSTNAALQLPHPSEQDSSAGHAVTAAVEDLLLKRSELQQELNGYLQQLSTRCGEDSQPLVELQEDYALLVERLLREGRAQQYKALQGWEGPHRFEDLPVAQLHAQHEDPKVAAGMAAIARLDEHLREASLKALVAARALNPEHWADAEKRRLERRAAELDAALDKERRRREHAAKLRGALNRLDEQGSEASLRLTADGSCSYYRLKPTEEALLAAVLSRDEAALEADNPFDPMLLNLDELSDSTFDGEDQGSSHAAAVQVLHDKASAPGEQPGVKVSSSRPSQADSGVCYSDACDIALTDTAVQATSACETPGASGSASDVTSRDSSCREWAVFDLMRPSTGSARRRCSLAEIDAQLEAIQAERKAALQLKLGSQDITRANSLCSSSCSSKGNPSSRRTLSTQCSTGRSTSTSSAVPPSGAAKPPGSSRPSRIPSASAASGMAAASSSPTRSTSARRCSTSSSGGPCRNSNVRTIDYISEQREVKELLRREQEIDAQWRQLRTSELQGTLSAKQLQSLLLAAY